MRGNTFLSEGKICTWTWWQRKAKDLKEAQMSAAQTVKGSSEGRNPRFM